MSRCLDSWPGVFLGCCSSMITFGHGFVSIRSSMNGRLGLAIDDCVRYNYLCELEIDITI